MAGQRRSQARPAVYLPGLHALLAHVDRLTVIEAVKVSALNESDLLEVVELLVTESADVAAAKVLIATDVVIATEDLLLVAYLVPVE